MVFLVLQLLEDLQAVLLVLFLVGGLGEQKLSIFLTSFVLLLSLEICLILGFLHDPQVNLSLLWIAQCLLCLFYSMPGIFGSWIFASIWMQDECEGFILLLDLILSSSALQLKDIIWVVKLLIGETIDLCIRFEDLGLDGFVFDCIDLTRVVVDLLSGLLAFVHSLLNIYEPIQCQICIENGGIRQGNIYKNKYQFVQSTMLVSQDLTSILTQPQCFLANLKQAELLQNNLYQDIMNSGGLRRGLHIDDDDAPEKYQYGGIEADRKKGKTQQSLDDMLFGKAPVRRRAPSGDKPAETAKPAEPAKTVEPQKEPTSGNTITVPPSNQGKPVTPQTNVKAPQSPPKNEASKPNIKPTQSTVINPNKSTDSSKNANQNNANNAITINSNAKVVINAPSKPITTNAKNEPSIIVPSNQAESKYPAVVNNIPIQSQPVLPQKPIVNPQKPQPTSLPAQPTKVDEPVTIDVLHPFSVKNSFNKPAALRKLKKPAEDFKFAQENISLHIAIDVVRPLETDRSRQKKLNDYDFKDYEFPSSSISLGGEHKGKASVWKKQSQLAKTVSFGKYIDPNDINPGTLSNPHFVSTLSALSQSQANIKRLIEDQKPNSNGFYLIRLFINSVWRYITVEGSLPYIENQHAGVVSNPDSQFQLSSALIEKAYAKSFGGYHTFSLVQPREHYLRDLTGAPVKKYSIQNPDLSNIIKKALTNGQIILAVPNEKIASLGLNPNYSYPVLNLTAKGSLQLRNSFGTLQEKSKVSLRPQGNFDLGVAQVRDFISHILITNLNSSYATTTIQSRHRQGFYSSYNFKIRKATHGFLTVSQWDERLFPLNSGYAYSPFHVVLHKVEEDGESTYISAAFTAGSRNLDLEVNLSPGVYTVFVSANWKHSEYAYNLTFYGSERIDFERIYNEKVPNLIGQSLESINLQQGKRVDLNKNAAQYFLYHPDSNLIVLTMENTSDKDATVTADLSKVKLDHLVLLTSHNNEDNYSNKVGLEIDEYKQIPLTDRKWSVSLPGQHRFTWILATDQPYDESNPKSWGFN